MSDILLGSLGLAGVLIVLGVLLAALFAGLLFLWRTRSTGPVEDPDKDLHIV